MKDTCKQAIFRTRYQESQEEFRTSGQQEIKKRENWSFSTEGTKHEHRIKDSDGLRSDDFLENIQGTTLQAMGGDDKSAEQSDAKEEQCGDRNGVVEPRSYRDVLANG